MNRRGFLFASSALAAAVVLPPAFGRPIPLPAKTFTIYADYRGNRGLKPRPGYARVAELDAEGHLLVLYDQSGNGRDAACTGGAWGLRDLAVTS